MFAPGGNELVEMLALPPAKFTVPRVTLPAVNVTDPLAKTSVLVLTDAVNLTDCPVLEGFIDEVRVVVEEAGFTVSFNTDELLFALRASPLYVAVSE